MKIKKAIVKAYTDAFGFKVILPETLVQSDAISFKAINIVFGNYQEFLIVLAAEKELAKPKKVVKK